MLSAAGRPVEVFDWVKRGRQSFATKLRARAMILKNVLTWWIGIQPGWRELVDGEIPTSREVKGNWADLHFFGLNGIVNIPVAMLIAGRSQPSCNDLSESEESAPPEWSTLCKDMVFVFGEVLTKLQ
jgi:hypothetical protein